MARAIFSSLVSHLPTADILRASGVPMTEWDRLITLTPASPEWKEFDFVRDGDKTRVPGLHIDSWYDEIEAYPTVKMFQYLSGNSPNQHLVMGPTAHCEMGTETPATSVGDRTVGDGRFDYVTLVTRWFDRWLKDDASVPELPRGPVLRAEFQRMEDGAGVASARQPPGAALLVERRTCQQRRPETAGSWRRSPRRARRRTSSSTIPCIRYRRSGAAAAPIRWRAINPGSKPARMCSCTRARPSPKRRASSAM